MSAFEYDSLAVSPSSEEPLETPSLQSPSTMDEDLTSGLEELQTDEQRRVLDAIAQVRKCGLESILSLPQLVVCGDQSAGKLSPRSFCICWHHQVKAELAQENHRSSRHLRRSLSREMIISVPVLQPKSFSSVRQTTP